MLSEDKYFKNLTEAELWQRYCGFLDLSTSEFMDIQKGLLMDEIERVADSTLGKKIMGDKKPESVEEFRRTVPVTKYDDYEPYLGERQEDALSEKPATWCHSSGRGGKYKWIPYTNQAIEQICKLFITCFILAAANKRGEVRIKPGDRFMSHMPPRPYTSGTVCYYTSKMFSIRFIPPLEESESMEFQERIQRSFQLALRTGVDEISSISSVLVKVGERMKTEAQQIKLSSSMLHPRVLSTFFLAFLRSKLAKRPILPKDLWNPKCIMTGGTDTNIYRDDIAHYWGTTPWEIFGCTENPFVAIHNWNRRWLTFVPYWAFWEFIPEEESLKLMKDDSYQPSTVLLDELEKGKLYEIVLTHFYGMPLLRYRLRDVIKVVDLRDDESGVSLPQIVFHARVGETIDLAALTRLSERVIWQAISNSGIKYEEWTACKEYDRNKTYLRIYIEMKEEREAAQIERLVDEQLKIIDPEYRDIDSWLELQPVKVTILPKGTFRRYYDEKVKDGADLAHLKPQHVNAPEAVIEKLLYLSKQS